MDTASRFLEALAHQQPRVLHDVLERFNKQSILVLIKASRDWLHDGLEICSRQHIKFTGNEGLASCGGDESSVSLVTAIDCICCEAWRLAVS